MGIVYELDQLARSESVSQEQVTRARAVVNHRFKNVAGRQVVGAVDGDVHVGVDLVAVVTERVSIADVNKARELHDALALDVGRNYKHL